MFKYAVLNSDNLCIDIIEVSNRDTFDGYELPQEQCSLIISTQWENEAQIGLHFNPFTNLFE